MPLAYILLFLFQNIVPGYIMEYHDIKNKDEELSFINKYTKNKEISTQAYVVSLEMKQAEYKLMPWQKLSVFNKGKQKLEQLISENENNADLRYVRLVIQEQLPKLLNYNADIEKDKQFLSDLLKTKNTKDYLDSYILTNTSL